MLRTHLRTLSSSTHVLTYPRFFSQQSLTESHTPPIDPETKKPMTNWDYSVELNAFRNRFAVPISDVSVIQRALTHKSYVQADAKLQNREHNDRYAIIGQTVMTHFVMEHFFLKYPNLSSSALRDCHNFIVDIPQLVKTAKHLGTHELYLTKEKVEDKELDVGLAEALLAIIGSIYVDQGPLYARQLVQEFVLYSLQGSDIYNVIKLEHPIQVLEGILAIKGREKPSHELLWETGRDTERSTFCVSVHSGEEKLAEGVGQSIQRARHDAYQTAVLQLFYKELRKFKLPSDLYGTTYNLDTKI
ncbi:hypothetical protein LOD99_13624 [Oopsacas minuta]|uniref:Large ribosomal subunit protein mL44 n=1 Tax=Oopsacas minuta TaxID=111878 RepID=A0AAV7KJ06_9METZ|nr:hypothetical protein LOD99_13624 [Oopsacas minuta]